MGGVLAQEAPLLERLHHEGDVALLEVPNAAVDELGRAAGGPLPEVALLEQQHVVAAGGRVEGHTHAGGPAPDHDDVPGLARRERPLQHLRSVHTISPLVPEVGIEPTRGVNPSGF